LLRKYLDVPAGKRKRLRIVGTYATMLERNVEGAAAPARGAPSRDGIALANKLEASIAALVMCLASPVLGQATPAEPAPAPAPVGAAPPPAYDAEIAPEYEYPTDDREPSAGPCALGDFCLGPVLTLGVPNLVGIGAHVRIGKFVGVGADYQYLPTFGIQSVPVDASSITLEGRLYPTGDSFFVGGGFAYQSVTAEGRRLVKDPNGVEFTLAGKGEVGLPLLKLGIGWLGYAGAVIGIDLAIEIPLGSRKLDITTTGSDGSEVFDDEVAALRRNVQDQADHMLDILPLVIQLNFLRLGYMF
jgi:hypothetical protein